MVLSVIIACVFIGFLYEILTRIWEPIENWLGKLVSIFVPAIIAGVVLGGIAILGHFISGWETHFYGVHWFWVGFGLGLVWEIGDRLRLLYWRHK